VQIEKQFREKKAPSRHRRSIFCWLDMVAASCGAASFQAGVYAVGARGDFQRYYSASLLSGNLADLAA